MSRRWVVVILIALFSSSCKAVTPVGANSLDVTFDPSESGGISAVGIGSDIDVKIDSVLFFNEEQRLVFRINKSFAIQSNQIESFLTSSFHLGHKYEISIFIGPNELILHRTAILKSFPED